MNKHKSVESIVSELKERAKELSCLYNIEEVLRNYDGDLDTILASVTGILVKGWQFPEYCCSELTYDDKSFRSKNFIRSGWELSSDIYVDEKISGKLSVYYTMQFPESDFGPFLKEEKKLIDTLADKVGQYIFHRNLKRLYESGEIEESDAEDSSGDGKWKTIIELLKETDRNLYVLIARKMMNLLYWSGVKEAGSLLNVNDNDGSSLDAAADYTDDNKPLTKIKFREITDEVFKIASEHLSEEDILVRLEKWIQEDKSSYLVRKLEDQSATLSDISDALRRYINHMPVHTKLAEELDKSLRVSLIRRFLSEDLSFIGTAKKYLTINDFDDIFHRTIYNVNSHGKLGGKSSGLFLASSMLRDELPEIYSKLRIPKTWYISSDGLMDFIRYNNLEEVFEQKYKDLDVIRQEYPYIVQLFKNSSFSPEMMKSFSAMLDDLREVPLIVRSSTLLEDGTNAAFSGKYKSLFIANRGSKKKRIEDLTSAIAEVYASVFNTDAIEYRMERNLLDYNEQMGIIVQEVVGRQVGKFYFPLFAGVAFSNNEFRWSPRIKKEDGLIRLVAGLGTRAVDRVSDDYPILVSPGAPGLSANVTFEETVKYSPKRIDVINLETGSFDTVEIKQLLKEYGNEIPSADKIFTVYKDGHPVKSVFLDYEQDFENAVATFGGLINSSPFIKEMQAILNTLKKHINRPVDIEFAFDGENLFLLQCRTQSSLGATSPSPIPKDIQKECIVFTANRFISNGRIPEITHVVYVDADAYSNISDLKTLHEVGRAVGKLNKLLPKRQFILIGPGRWGSRGDIKLGVNVTYSDINNTAVLIEVAKKKGNYVPDLSFGTHFFQDLVEASIKYIPLYPDDEATEFNENFLNNSHNILPDLLPEFAHLIDTVKVIDVKQRTDGKIIRILLNSDLDEALAYLTKSTGSVEQETYLEEFEERRTDVHWIWRLRMAEKIAENLDSAKFGVKAFYVFGSTKNATSGPGSDIDIMIHFGGTEEQRKELSLYLDGWGTCLAELNYLKTGYKTSNILDVHLITDEDIANKSSYAIKIGAVTDAARKLETK
jgi:pyruvate, water dikinase